MEPLKLSLLLIFFLCVPAFAAGDSSLGPCDAWIPAEGKQKAVMVLTHGLNLRPSRMDDLGHAFAAAGYEVLRGSFTGHCTDAEALRHIKFESWDTDARRFHALASARAKEKKLPLVLAAYSFSGLIFDSLRTELPFDRRVFFAPALETAWWYPLAVLLIRIYPSMNFRTRIPDGYYSHEYPGFRSVLAMDHFVKLWRENATHAADSPTLVWADLNDELVNAKALKKIALTRKGWQFADVSVEGCTLPEKYHHLIVTEAALGSAEWKRVVERSLAFLAGDEKNAPIAPVPLQEITLPKSK